MTVTSAAGLVLAAGAGSRIGTPKALLPWADGLLLDAAVALLRDGGVDEVVVVTGAEALRVSTEASRLGATTAYADAWMTGMGASLRAGLAHLATTPHEQAVIALVDQPGLGPESVRRLLATTGEAAVATYGGVPTHPVRLARKVWSEVAGTADGDVGARSWLRSHAGRVQLVPCDGTGDPADIDTAADLTRLLTALEGRRHSSPADDAR